MPAHGVIPAIRVSDMAQALRFYVDTLGFRLERGGPGDGNCAVSRGDARLMVETAGDWFSHGYNEAIRRRLEAPPSISLYMEAPDLEALYDRVRSLGVTIVDPLADRPWGQAEFTIEDPDGTWLSFWRATADA